MKAIRQKFRDSKLRHKLMAIYICIGTVPVLLLGIFVYCQQRTNYLEKEKRAMDTQLSREISQLDSQLASYANLSDYIAFNSSISDGLCGKYGSVYEMYEQYADNIDPVISSLKYFNKNIEQISVYVDRDIVRHSDTILPLSDIEGEEWYRDAELDQNNQWFLDEGNKTAFNVRIMPLMQQKGERGILYISVDYSELFSQLEKISREEYGIVIYYGKCSAEYKTEYFQGKEGDLLLSHRKVQQDFSKQAAGKGSVYMMASKELAVQGWNAIMYCPKNEAATAANPLLLFVAGLVLICVAASLAASLAFSRLVVHDIEKLQKNMKSVEQGDMTIWVESDSQDEIGDLIHGFDTMIGEINRLIHEVYEGKLLQRKYEMKALQAQINPHFLYNSLSLINWKALEAGEEDISKITLALSSFYRTSLNKGNNVLTIERELENMHSYLEIQSCMHDSSFDVEEEIDSSILPYETLNLLLQPLVENAIEHGVDLLEDRRGCIRIIGRADEENIYLIVEDNGVGMEEEILASILEFQTRGYGVRNVNERIRLFYGEEYSLRIESELGRGTRCIITIPQIISSAAGM